MKRKLGFGLAFVLLSVLICNLINWVLFDNIHSYSRHMLYEMYNSPENIDTVFLGSSHCYTGVDPFQVSEQLGVNAFSCGSSQQNLGGSYYMLREAAQYHSLKTVYLEMFYSMSSWASARQFPKVDYLLSDYMRPGRNKLEFLLNIGPAAFIDDLLPARHSTISPNEILSTWKAKLTDGNDMNSYAHVTYPEAAYQGRGFVRSYEQVADPALFSDPASVPIPIDPEKPMADYSREMLDKIGAFCRENNIRLVLFSAVMPSAFINQLENYQAYVDFLNDWCAQNGAEYWDFCLYRGLEDLETGDFSDAHHLSSAGEDKMTLAFCQAASAAEPSECFYPTVAEKLAVQPDKTYGEGA